MTDDVKQLPQDDRHGLESLLKDYFKVKEQLSHTDNPNLWKTKEQQQEIIAQMEAQK